MRKRRSLLSRALSLAAVGEADNRRADIERAVKALTPGEKRVLEKRVLEDLFIGETRARDALPDQIPVATVPSTRTIH